MLDEPYQNLIKPCKVAWELSETAAEPPHTAKPMTIKFDFFSGLVSFSFFFFCYLLPLFFFISIFWRGARGAQNEAKDAANGRNGKSQNLQKSSILGPFFARGNGEKRWKSSTLLFGAGGEKSQNYGGGAVTPRGPLSPPSQGRRSGGYPPETPSPPLLGGSSSLWGGPVAQPFPPLTTSCHPLVLLLFLLPPVPITPATSFLLL